MNETRNEKLTPFAQRLRKEMTPEEKHLWYDYLKKLPWTVNRQKVFGNYIADFYIASAKLVIEADGSQHYASQGMAYDADRSVFLSDLGLEVLRFSNREIDRYFREVCEQIDVTIQNRLQDPLSHLR